MCKPIDPPVHKSDSHKWQHERPSTTNQLVGRASLLVVVLALILYYIFAASVEVYYPKAKSLVGRNILITGGSAGLGLESAKRLAAAGATTIFTTRTEAKGHKTLMDVQSYLHEQEIDNTKVFFL